MNLTQRAIERGHVAESIPDCHQVEGLIRIRKRHYVADHENAGAGIGRLSCLLRCDLYYSRRNVESHDSCALMRSYRSAIVEKSRRTYRRVVSGKSKARRSRGT